MAFLLVKFIPELLYNQWITVTQTFISTPYFHLSLCPIWAWLLVLISHIFQNETHFLPVI